MKQFNNIALNSKGLTLIEMIAAVGIFAIVVGTISSLFISAIRAQRKSLAIQELLDRTSYVVEYLGRALRMARKELDSPPTCLTLCGTGCNYEIIPNGIRFIDYEGVCTNIFLDAEQIKKSEGVFYPPVFPPAWPLAITPLDLKITHFNVGLFGERQADDFQPRATIFLEIESRRIAKSPPKIQVQTSISQRALDVEY